jgi:hypothetical protein
VRRSIEVMSNSVKTSKFCSRCDQNRQGLLRGSFDNSLFTLAHYGKSSVFSGRPLRSHMLHPRCDVQALGLGNCRARRSVDVGVSACLVPNPHRPAFKALPVIWDIRTARSVASWFEPRRELKMVKLEWRTLQDHPTYFNSTRLAPLR